MNNFERRKTLDYLEKLLCVTDLKNFNFVYIFNFLVKEFKINKKKYPLLNNGSPDTDSTKSCSILKWVLYQDVIKLKQKIKPVNTVLENKLLILKSLYDLSNEEYEILVLLILREVNQMIDDFYYCLDGNKFRNFAMKYLKVRAGKQSRLIDTLRKKKIVDTDDIVINSELLEIFDNEDCNTPSKIAKVLLGKTEKSALKISNYPHLKDKLEIVTKLLARSVEENRQGVNILLYGGVGTGKTEFAKLIANSCKIPMYSVVTTRETFKEADREDRLADLYSKQYLLKSLGKSCILFDEGEDAMNRYGYKGYLNRILETTNVPVIWTTNNVQDVDPAFLRRMTYCIEFKELTEDTRLKIWEKAVKKSEIKINRTKLIELNKSYNIPPSLIINAIANTEIVGGNADDFEGFIENVAQVVTKKKNVKNKKEFTIQDYDENLVNSDIDIKNLTSRIKSSGKMNFSLCLYGEPGTGKSLYARYLAKNLGIEVVMKRASDLISPYVGETEKHIAAAFAEAKAKKAMLIFDEADSFLQNRNNAMRRWEVSQVNEMLTWMEVHEYPFICTTNLLDSLDEASLRRFTFKIRFDFLNQKQVNCAIEHFWGIKNTQVDIKGLTAGDFATVKKKTDILGIENLNEILKMLEEEVKIKKSEELKQAIGF